MRDLYVKNLVGEMFPLSRYKVTRNVSTENSARTIKVDILLEEQNFKGYRELRNKTYLIYEGETYVIENISEVTTGNFARKSIVADHIFYQNMKLRNRIYTTITGDKTPTEILTFILKDTGYTFRLDSTGLPDKITVENFGNNNPLALLQDFTTNMIKGEFDYTDSEVIVAKEIGRITDKQMRYEFNISGPQKEIDTTNLRTTIKGFSTQNPDGSYYYIAEYTSPLAEVYGTLIAEPVYDDRYKSSATLRQRLINDLTDTLDFSIRLTATQLADMDLRDVRKGDYVWCIIDPFDIDIRVRVVDIEDYEDENKDPVFTLGKVKRKASSIISQYRNATKAFNAIYDPNTKKVKSTAVDTANISVDLGKATGQVKESQLPFTTANATNAGLMSASDYIKLSNLNVGSDGSVSVPLATALNNGLLSKELFQKLNNLQVDANGLAIVDLNNNATIQNILNRLTALENK